MKYITAYLPSEGEITVGSPFYTANGDIITAALPGDVGIKEIGRWAATMYLCTPDIQPGDEVWSDYDTKIPTRGEYLRQTGIWHYLQNVKGEEVMLNVKDLPRFNFLKKLGVIQNPQHHEAGVEWPEGRILYKAWGGESIRRPISSYKQRPPEDPEEARIYLIP